ncbi:MAG: SusC/RagA family TonB-linked outer membrane protein [Bacteroidales bacterium]|nr:SusC/RagA family TonB-linked outer membrane protein [Bacteroidales bacterium]
MKYIKSTFILFAMLAVSPLTMNAQTAENESDSDTQVQIAYRTVAEGDLIGSVAVLDYEELTDKNYNTYSLDNMQAYVSGFNGNSLWGMDGDNNQGYLVLIDGVPRAANNILPTEISSITFLKSAQAVVLYGSRAAKGAILITTKRGTNDGLQVSVRANTGVHVAKAFPEYLGAAEYMTYYNEALANDGKPALYTQDEIYYHSAGLNPYRYPDINYYSSEYINKAYNRSDVTAEISGGGGRAHFYSNISYYNQGDFLKVGEAANNNISRFNVRGNVDVKLNDYVKAYINANTTFYDSKSGKGNYWEAAATMRPNFPQHAAPLIPVSMIDPNAIGAWDLINASGNIITKNGEKYFLSGTQQNKTNVFADMYAAGRSKWTSRQFQFDTGVDIDLQKVLKGLKFKTVFALDYATSYSTSYDNNYAIFTPTWSMYNGKEYITDLKQEGLDEKSGNQNINGSDADMTILWTGQFNYDRTFAAKHNVSAMLVAGAFRQTLAGEYHRVANANLGILASYNYDHRYYFDFSGAAVHSAKLAPGHRGAFSPSVTLGWKIGNEAWMDGSDFDDLTVSVSGSILNQDIDIAGYYLYAPTWATDRWGYGWADGEDSQYAVSTRGANELLSFIKRKEFSVNVNGALFDRTLTFDASYFIQSMEGYLIDNTTTWPSHMATSYPDQSFIPWMNYNNNGRTGLDLSINYNKTFGDFALSFGLNTTIYETLATRRDEVYTDHRQREGKPLDGIWGYQSAGLFQSQEEIDGWYEQNLGSTVRPGDIKYVDQNGDGVVNADDQIYLGRGGWYGNPLTFGANLTLKYKSFTLFALATAGTGAYGMKNSTYYWIDAEDKYSAIVRDRWTPETAATATYPRLTVSEGANNLVNSDFWMYKNNRFDLAKVQLTYDMSQSILKNNKVVKGFSAYISGSNLLTISPERKHLEMAVGEAPQTRFYNLGVKLTF